MERAAPHLLCPISVTGIINREGTFLLSQNMAGPRNPCSTRRGHGRRGLRVWNPERSVQWPWAVPLGDLLLTAFLSCVLCAPLRRETYFS